MNNEDKPPFLIGPITALIRWLELLVLTVSAPVLTFAGGVAVVDILTGGRLLQSQPGLLFAFGVALAVGIDTRLPAACEKIRDCMEAEPKRLVQAFLWLVIAVWTGAVILLALRVFSIEQSAHISEAEALTQIGIDADTFNTQRDLLAVVLMSVSGFARWRKKTTTENYATEREHLQNEIANEPLRQQLNQIKLHGAAGVASGARKVVRAALTRPDGQEQPSALAVPLTDQPTLTTPLEHSTAAHSGRLPEDDPTPPAGPPQAPKPSPVMEDDAGAWTTTQEDFPTPSPYMPNIKQFPAPTPNKRTANGKAPKDDPRERAAFAIIHNDPTISADALAKLMHCRWKTADGWIFKYQQRFGKSSRQARG